MYNCSEFLEKNDDSMAAEIEQVLLRSTQPLIAAACAPPAVPETPAAEQGKHHKGERGGGSGGHSSFGSVGAKFVKSLRELMAELGSADAHFVRCVKPNAELVPLKLHGEDVVNQLRMSGMLDAVKLIQAGYPTRIPYEAIHSRYSRVFPPEIQSLPPAEFSEVLAGVCDVRPHSYFLGKHRIFFNPNPNSPTLTLTLIPTLDLPSPHHPHPHSNPHPHPHPNAPPRQAPHLLPDGCGRIPGGTARRRR